jgi:omega-hydroxy-beta-dihydromenaquinone-9 sulfotransferase
MLIQDFLRAKTMMTSTPSRQGSGRKNIQKHRVWAVKLWLGGDFFGWLRLLTRNRFAIGLCCLHWLVLISITTLINTALRYLQALIWGRRLRKTEITKAPLFIIGHWRTGTTWLHELLALDQHHTYPTTYECLYPNHFLLTEWCFSWLFHFFLPSRRPMDNMSMTWNSPQEDEFALCNLGQPSPYLTIAFPNRLPQYPEYFDLERASPKGLARWKACFLHFLRQVTVRNQKRIILKSPTHTYRIKVLLELFPDARFVHIVRNPYVVFPSTINLWQSLYAHQGLQHPAFKGLEEYVFDNFIHMFEKLEEVRPMMRSSRFFELRYEDLVQDPSGQLRAIYENLELGDFEQVLPKLKSHIAGTANHKANSYELPPELRDTITQRWGHVIQRYGYACDSDTIGWCYKN